MIFPVVYSPVQLMFEQLRPVMLLDYKEIATLSLFAKKILILLIINIYLEKGTALELIIINLLPADAFPCPLPTEQR